MSQEDTLSGRCSDVARLSRAALDWINDPENEQTVSGRAGHLPKMLRKSARRAERLGRAAKTKMSISVFGPSQAGKSFLVSVLARPSEGRLVADFNGPGGKLDYISQVNPAGDGESTGLVTRFTMSRNKTPEGFPIQLNLLTEADIARTLINSFYEDGDLSEEPPSPETLTAHFAAHSGKAQATETGGLDYEEVFEIADYVQKWVTKSSYAFNLAGFWDEAAELAPRMTPEDRGQFLSILWGGYEPLTDLYIKLSKALASISHAEVIYTALDSLQPRETSIIDVNTLDGLFGPENEDMLQLQTAAGQKGQLNRAVVTALAAELVFPMEEAPSDFFHETDLLDFPGARNRFEAPLSVTLRNPEEAVTNMLLRGKVAYLFDRYVSNQEITSMLLCVPDSNMETLSLPGLVEQWIDLTHGSTPEERAKNDCILFFVMTKFDKHLIDSAGQTGGVDTERFERRMDASLIKGFGKVATSWVHKWAGSEPFKNCYWLRNPYYPIEALIKYENERETEVLPDKVQRVAELKESCLTAEPVQRHFKDPERAWEAALGLNDGGVSYLIEELTKVCKPESKLRQISTQIEAVAHKLHQEMGQFYVSDDVEKRIEEKRLAAGEIIDGLEVTLSHHRFGAFMNALSVDQDAIQDRISRVPSSVRITNAVAKEVPKPSAAATTPGPARPGAPLRPGRPARPTAAAAAAPEPKQEAEVQSPAAKSIRTMTPEAFQADTAISVWIEGLERFRADEDRLAIFQLNGETGGTLVNEIVHGFTRVDVRESIMEMLTGISYGLTVDKQAPSAAIVCSERINNFVTTLGAREMVNGTPLMIDLGNGESRAAFEHRQGADSAASLPEMPRPAAADTWTDWVFALDTLFVENAKDGEAGTVNIEQNIRLGSVLGELSPTTG
ncbi:virulence factor SrfC family protein [uncultured Tateyamaria sp.]|uniref:virulence factor SrfC family protein n=1 Tax=uncultured Tateyamaria sp. TaxID=455651 RepID=UPI00261E53CC|nr:virulence factor SrfC family protein [uncultured Tateyamaria sp.]